MNTVYDVLSGAGLFFFVIVMVCTFIAFLMDLFGDDDDRLGR